jgi:putative ABC transport system permease protein
MERSKSILERRHNAPGHYEARSMEQEMQSANKILGIVGLVIGLIAGISLLVGGIGVMNIMLVSVTERTREIGIRMALGARRQDILVQFLFESIVLCLMGGIIGTVLGYGGAYVVAKIAHWPPLVSWWTILIAFLFSAGVGLFFGLYPANQAARLKPIEALRRE